VAGVAPTPLTGADRPDDHRQVSILAHISDIGDVYAEHGVINSAPGQNNELQGLQLSSELQALEYKVQDHFGGWTDWVGEDIFVGTRAQAKYLRGIAVRVKDELRDQWGVTATCRFTPSLEIKSARDGEELMSGAENAICGLQLDLRPQS
jgi:hypothetical protein